MLPQPTNTEELATMLRSYSEAGKRVRIVGGGTKQAWGRAVEAEATLSTAGLHRLREHVWQDMTCTVDAGMPWAAMQSALAQHGQFVALDPLFPHRATVGGVLATNDSGALRLKYGSLRDLVIGITLVLPDGSIAKSGGKVVKNVAGYDLPKLMIGAFGTLGVVTEVTFRLHALPRHARHVSLTADLAALQRTMLSLASSQLSIESLQLRDAQHLDLALSAMPEVVEAQLATLRGFTEITPDIWKAREALFADPGSVVLKASTLPTNIATIVERIAELGGTSVAQSTGLITAALPRETDIAPLRAALEREQGSLVLLQQTGTQEVWGAPPNSLPLMQAIKQQFDPRRTLNPGIFLDGI